LRFASGRANVVVLAMPADPRDRFEAFAGNEHMFFGLAEPFTFIRGEIEKALAKQVADTIVDSIVTEGEPKFLTLGRNVEGGKQLLVTWFGCCVRAKIFVSYDANQKHELVHAAITSMFGRWDEGAERRVARFHLDVHDGAERAYDDGFFKNRFMQFRIESDRPAP
jgi:hypothetical protein